MTKTRKKIAIIGSGISGLGSAYILAQDHDITVYEKNNYIGGHSRTVDVPTDNAIVPVDTGFIVFNHRNYPLLTGLFKHLDVPTVKSDMSFGASVANGAIEYGTQQLSNIFAQRSNLLRPRFWRMVSDILRFNAKAHQFLDADPAMTLGECLDALNMGDWFRDYYLLAMGGAIWSTPVSGMLDFPARTFIRFFDNHGLLTVNDQPQWYTVQGGSREYVKRVSAGFRDAIRLNCGVTRVERLDDHVRVHDVNGGVGHFDEVVFACHSDQALAMIDAPSQDETRVLGNMRYQPNRMVLHRDISFMPKRKRAWASWIYISETTKDNSSNMCLSYWMNNLQPLATQQPIIVTLNPTRDPDPSMVYDEYWFDHPVFDGPAVDAQGQIDRIQGADRLWFCGAYQRYGFHEDGLLSAVTMAEKMGTKRQWT